MSIKLLKEMNCIVFHTSLVKSEVSIDKLKGVLKNIKTNLEGNAYTYQKLRSSNLKKGTLRRYAHWCELTVGNSTFRLERSKLRAIPLNYGIDVYRDIELFYYIDDNRVCIFVVDTVNNVGTRGEYKPITVGGYDGFGWSGSYIGYENSMCSDLVKRGYYNKTKKVG